MAKPSRKQITQHEAVLTDLVRRVDLIVHQMAESNLRLLYVMHQVIIERTASSSPILIPGEKPTVERGTLWEFYQAEHEAFLAQMERVYADVESAKRRAAAQAAFTQGSGSEPAVPLQIVKTYEPPPIH